MLVLQDHDTRDSGALNNAPGSQRQCAATGEATCIDSMIRFVLGPEGAVVPDVKRRLPGRGLWVTATRSALDLAIRRKSFARGFRRDVVAASDLAETTERLLEQAALDALAMAHKAAKVVIGFGRIEKTLARERVVALLKAADAAPDGVRKLEAARARREDASAIAVIGDFASAQLDLALGRSNVIHAALLAGRESETFIARAARLHCFRTGSMAGLMDRNGNPSSTKATARHASVENATEKTRLREIDRDRNG